MAQPPPFIRTGGVAAGPSQYGPYGYHPQQQYSHQQGPPYPHHYAPSHAASMVPPPQQGQHAPGQYNGRPVGANGSAAQGYGGHKGPSNHQSGARSNGSGGHSSNNNNNNNNQKALQNFKKLELVGKGAYGAVYRGVHLASSKPVALKVVNLDTPEDDVSEIQREVALLSQLRETTTKNVIKYWGCWLLGPELWIVMDYAEGGSVRTVMNAGPIAERYAAIIVRESLVALSYLHKSGIIHRDIKAANILLTNAGDVLLCDFGVAASFVSSSVHSRRTTFVGTPYWMAPEVITQGKSYDQSADIWSLGITIYEMCTGNPPYADQEQMRAIMMIPKNKPSRLPTDGAFTQPLREFVALCLNEEPRERPNADELSKTKWIKTNAKVPNSTLRDLINAYTSWSKTGGMRMSLLGAEANGLNDPANRDSFAFDGHETSEGWEFSSGFEDFSEEQLQSVPSAPLRDHPLLRLFDQNDGDGQPALNPERGGAAQNTAQQVAAAQYKGAEVRPAPPPPGPAPERPPAGALVESKSVAMPTAQANEQPRALETVQPPLSASSAAQDNKKAFTGTGSTPFRFGGGGGGKALSPSPSPLPSQQTSNDQFLRERSGSSTRHEAPSVEDNASTQNDLNDQVTASRDAFERRKDAHKRQGSILSSRSSSVHAEGISGNALARHHHTQSSTSASAYSHSPGASETNLQVYRPSANVENTSVRHAQLGNLVESDSVDVIPSESFGSNLVFRSQSNLPITGSANASGPSATFFEGQAISSSPASEISKLPVAASTSAVSLAGANAMPPPPAPGMTGRPIGPGMRSRSGSRSRPWQGMSESDFAASEFAALPPVPRRGALAKHLGLPVAGNAVASNSSLSNGIASGLSASPSIAQHIPAAENGVLASPAALHQRRQHGGSDPTQLVARRYSREALHERPKGQNDSRDGTGAPKGNDSTDHAAPEGASQAALLASGAATLPDINMSMLAQKEDVYLELDRTVENLGRWLDVVGSGLARVVGST